MGAIPPLGHPRPPKRRRPPRVSPGGLPRALRAKIRLGKALHVLEPAIDAHRSARARIAAAWGRMAARSLDCLEQLGFGLGSQGQGQHGWSSRWTAKSGRRFICSWRSCGGQETKRSFSTNQLYELGDLARREGLHALSGAALGGRGRCARRALQLAPRAREGRALPGVHVANRSVHGSNARPIDDAGARVEARRRERHDGTVGVLRAGEVCVHGALNVGDRLSARCTAGVRAVGSSACQYEESQNCGRECPSHVTHSSLVLPSRPLRGPSSSGRDEAGGDASSLNRPRASYARASTAHDSWLSSRARRTASGRRAKEVHGSIPVC